MPRQKNDGRGRMGGRKKGTPNKEQSIKSFLRSHSNEYFTPSIEEVDADGKKTGRIVSQYDIDTMQMKPADRVNAELQLLKFHTPMMQATSVDMSLSEDKKSFADRLERLSNGEDLKPDDDE